MQANLKPFFCNQMIVAAVDAVVIISEIVEELVSSAGENIK